jgi:hypothetical protein
VNRIGLAIATFLFAACGSESSVVPSTTDSYSESGDPVASRGAKLQLDPAIEVSGIGDIFAMLDVTRLSFDAELFLIPVESAGTHTGDAVSVRFEFDEDLETRVVPSRKIYLSEAGAYRVLLRLARSAEGVSMGIDGVLSNTYARKLHKAVEEPAPTAASGKDEEPAPTAASTACEPAPTAADGNDEADSEDAEADCEPAPTAADENDEAGRAYEPAPTAADGNEDPSAEPAPTAAEPAPTAAREKATIDAFEFTDGVEEDASLSISTRQEYEFYAGVVELEANDSALVVHWDVRTWLRSVLAEPLGMSAEDIELTSDEFAQEPGFDGPLESFDLETR